MAQPTQDVHHVASTVETYFLRVNLVEESASGHSIPKRNMLWKTGVTQSYTRANERGGMQSRVELAKRVRRNKYTGFIRNEWAGHEHAAYT